MICFVSKYIINFCCTCSKWCAFLNATSMLSSAATVMFPVTKINISEKSQRLDLIFYASNLIASPSLDLPFVVLLSMTYHFFAANFHSSVLESFNKFVIFVFPFYMMLTEFCKNSKFFFF